MVISLFLLEITFFSVLTSSLCKILSNNAELCNKRKDKRFNNRAYSLFFFAHLYEASVIDSKYIKTTGLQDIY